MLKDFHLVSFYFSVQNLNNEIHLFFFDIHKLESSLCY